MTSHSRRGGGGVHQIMLHNHAILCCIMLNLKEITTEKTKKKSEYLNHVLRSCVRIRSQKNSMILF